MSRRRKTPTMGLGNRSERRNLRVAMVLAWENLDWLAQEKFRNKAKDLLHRLAEVRP